jgi:hypothetical protein
MRHPYEALQGLKAGPLGGNAGLALEMQKAMIAGFPAAERDYLTSSSRHCRRWPAG